MPITHLPHAASGIPTVRPHAWMAGARLIGELGPTEEVDLLDAAAVCDARGTEATLNGLLEALRHRHADDRVTQAILAAVQDYHLPNLREELRGL